MKMKPKVPTFLKWAGGKRRILNALQPLFPKKIERYFEPFLGGGSMFFYVMQKYRPSFATISDINADLVEVYKTVRDNPHELIKKLKGFKKKDSEEFYYRTRDLFNQKKLQGTERSAAFIYMNKTAYSGLFRVNSKNEFNVPYGRYKNAEVFDEETLSQASTLLQGVEIKCQDYRDILGEIQDEDFIYLDPCYDPIKKTSFVQYTPEKFSKSDRERLSRFVLSAQKRGAKVLLSNNNVSRVKRLYPGFYFHPINAPRSLGARVGAKSEVIELAIKNYASVV